MPAFQLRFFTLKHTGEHIGAPLDWLRPEEERDSIRRNVSM